MQCIAVRCRLLTPCLLAQYGASWASPWTPTVDVRVDDAAAVGYRPELGAQAAERAPEVGVDGEVPRGPCQRALGPPRS